MGIFCKGKFSSKAGTVHCIGYKPQVAVWLLTAVSGSGPSPQEVNKSTLQRQKEAFSTKLQHFKIMMARLGFSQVLLLVGSEVDLKQQDSEDKSVLHMQKVMSHGMTQAQEVMQILPGHMFIGCSLVHRPLPSPWAVDVSIRCNLPCP